MKKSFHYQPNKEIRRTPFGILLLALALCLAVSVRSGAEDSDEELADLEKVIAEDAEGGDGKSATKASTEAEALPAELEEALGAPPPSPNKSVANRKAAKSTEPTDELDVELQKPTGQAPKAAIAPVAEESDEEFVNKALDDINAKEAPAKTVQRPVAPVSTPPSPRTAPVARKPAELAVRNQVSNLEFKMEGEGSRIVVSFRDKPTYREERNGTIRQIVYFFENTETPQRLQRAYDTTEFNSPVSMFTLLQMPSSANPVTKLIVQLREDKSPVLNVTSGALILDFPKPEGKYEPKIVVSEEEGASEENIYASGKIFSGKRIDRLEIKNSDIQDVLRLIAKTSGYNIVIGDDVSGKVGTISLQNIPWDQAFTLVLQSKKLGYIRQGNVLRVGTLAALKSEKEEALANEQSRVKVESLRTVLIPISYAKAAEIAPRLKGLLTERGNVDTDVRTNTLIVKDIDRVITRAQKLIAALDTQPPKVSIQAKVVEMLSSFSRGIGFSATNLNTSLGGINLSESISLAGAGSQSTTAISAPNLANLQATFQMGETENKVKVLASPSVTSVANVQATVTQSISFFVPTVEVAGGVAVTTLRQITANLSLDVTPIVAGDGSIFMTVNVRNEIPRGSGDSRTIDTRNVNTQVMLENGDTMVIGGIFNNTVNTTKDGLPFLMRIPVLGFFFSNTALEDTRNEIFVFLTAKILNPEESFKRTF